MITSACVLFVLLIQIIHVIDKIITIIDDGPFLTFGSTYI